MNREELANIIEISGGKHSNSNYTDELLLKINRLQNLPGFKKLMKQFYSVKNEGDFRGRVLEINFADLFIEKQQQLHYAVKQDMKGDIDFLWKLQNLEIFIEMKLLRESEYFKEPINQEEINQEEISKRKYDVFGHDIRRIQRDLIEKPARKFNTDLQPNRINFIAIDVTELKFGMIDVPDCLLAVGGSKLLSKYYPNPYHVDNVMGVFESDHIIEAGIHPRNYIHGVIFMFRVPKETAALSYKLNSATVWNSILVNDTTKKQFCTAFHQICPLQRL